MSKYIIRNCPAYIHKPLYTHDKLCLLGNKVKPNYKGLYVYCKDCTDCVMKQIVEKCKKEIKAELETEILKLLDVEEVE